MSPPHLSPFGLRVLEHLQQFRPKQAEALAQAGELETYAQNLANQGSLILDQGISSGLAYDQALELANEVMLLPEEPTE